MKKWDSLLTFDQVVTWCEPTSSSDIKFNVHGCIVFLLILKAGSKFYPEIDPDFLDSTLNETDSCGWNTEYEKLPVKYSKELLQMKPSKASDSRGSHLHSPIKRSHHLSKDEFMKYNANARKRSRHHSNSPSQ